MATIWLHKPSGFDFLIEFDSKRDALDFSLKAFDKGFSLLKEEPIYTMDSILLENVLLGDPPAYGETFSEYEEHAEIPNQGINIGTFTCLQVSMLPRGLVPDPSWYTKIANVYPEDALTMLFELEPECHFDSPVVFANREEPYNFMKYIPTAQELDEELQDYMIHA
jgi:hypothetical protein